MVTIPPKSYPSTSIEHDDITSVRNYLPSASTLEIVERFLAGLRGAKRGRMLSVTGPYGSGKSTMAAFLSGLLAPKENKEWKTASGILRKTQDSYERTLVDARKKAGIHERGMIRCAVTARREPVSVTLLRALDDGLTRHFGDYSKRFKSACLLHRYIGELKDNKVPDFPRLIELIEEITDMAPTVIMIDEFGKNIEYFASDESQQSDLFLLQDLAERSGRGRRIQLHIVTLQHMAFDEYSVGTSVAQKREWAKIQGRFEDIPFANSPDQTRLLVSRAIKLGRNAERDVKRWAKKESGIMQDLGINAGSDSDLVASCYPLGPLALEVLPELCSRYGQHERTLLSFVSDSKRCTVSTFIDEQIWDPNHPPTIGLDVLYDYFISGTGITHSGSASISRLMEIETIIRDAHGLTGLETKALKSIGILNLVGRSGYLRASRRMIDYSIGHSSRQVLDSLEKKSIITYRSHADEYRIWHGSDIDIAVKLDIYRKRCNNLSLAELLKNTISVEPVVAAKHGIETGTMRLFGRRFEPSGEGDESYDGTILYKTDETIPMQSSKKPVITVTASNATELRLAAIEVFAIRDILDSDDDILADWVAKKEIVERLADAEIRLDREFANTYGESAKWTYEIDGRKESLHGKPSMMASEVCKKAYCKTPVIRNEMINRTALSAQGSTAKKKLLEAMITNTTMPKFGIEGYGPERAMYEAVLYENCIHRPDTSLQWSLRDPKNNSISPVWNTMMSIMKKSNGRVNLSDIYKMAKLPPYGVKDGSIQLLITAMILVHKDTIAVYEHGTFVPKLRPEESERMTKNPEHFELKYFRNTQAKKGLLAKAASELEVADVSILGVVGQMVTALSALPQHIKSTKRLGRKTISVRDTILHAIEPDTLLFESLPEAMGFGPEMSEDEAARFSKTLARSVRTLQGAYERMLDDLCGILFESTGIGDRGKISRAAKAMEPSVADQRMKVFLAALSADTLEHRNDWINYVAMSLTDVPPADWKDEQRTLFENQLRQASAKFKRLAGIHFAKVSDSFTKPSYQVTVTHADGSEHHSVVSLSPKQKEKIQKIAARVRKEMKEKGFTESDVGALIAVLSSESE